MYKYIIFFVIIFGLTSSETIFSSNIDNSLNEHLALKAGNQILENYTSNGYTTRNETLTAFQSVDWRTYIETLTKYTHTWLIDKNHCKAIQLYEILNKKRSKSKQAKRFEHALEQSILKFLDYTIPQNTPKTDAEYCNEYTLTYNDKLFMQLHECTTWGAIDAIELYYHKRNNNASRITDLLPDLQSLEKNAHNEIAQIPQSIRNFYEQYTNHPFVQFAQTIQQDKDKKVQEIFKEAAHAVHAYFAAIQHDPTTSTQNVYESIMRVEEYLDENTSIDKDSTQDLFALKCFYQYEDCKAQIAQWHSRINKG